ncbi:MAG: DUF697 domain-containing protein, partial [Maricaulaceae bacterium]
MSALDGTQSLPADGEAERWEITRQWKLAWRALKWTFYGGLMIAALTIVGQVYLFYGLFSDIHPFAGYAFAAAVTIAFVWLIVLPAARFLHMPAMARPPEVDLARPDLGADDIAKRLKFDVTYLRALRKNPLMADRLAEVDAALSEAEKVPLSTGAVAAFERTQIDPLLEPLDRQVDRYIHAEATGVGAATAISMNGSIDAFIVLWRNLNMVSRVARIYYGRPSLRASALVLRDIAGAVILSRALEDVSE